MKASGQPRTIVLSVTVVLLLSLMAVAGAASPALAAPATCSKFTFIGLAGNGTRFETGSAVGELGPELAGVYMALALREPFKGDIRYLSVPKFRANVRVLERGYLKQIVGTGGALATFLPALDATGVCRRRTTYILGGYSQGAAEIRAALTRLGAGGSNTALLKRIGAVVLIGDPARTNSGIQWLSSKLKNPSDARALIAYSLDTCVAITLMNWPAPDCFSGAVSLNSAAVSATGAASVSGAFQTKGSGASFFDPFPPKKGDWMLVAGVRSIGNQVNGLRKIVDRTSSTISFQGTAGRGGSAPSGVGMVMQPLAGTLFLADLDRTWPSFARSVSAAPLGRPTYSYDHAGDLVSRATQVFNTGFLPKTRAGRALCSTASEPAGSRPCNNSADYTGPAFSVHDCVQVQYGSHITRGVNVEDVLGQYTYTTSAIRCANSDIARAVTIHDSYAKDPKLAPSVVTWLAKTVK